MEPSSKIFWTQWDVFWMQGVLDTKVDRLKHVLWELHLLMFFRNKTNTITTMKSTRLLRYSNIMFFLNISFKMFKIMDAFQIGNFIKREFTCDGKGCY